MGVVLLFLVLLQLQFCAADDNLERKLMKEMEKLQNMVNILTSRVQSQEDEIKRLRGRNIISNNGPVAFYAYMSNKMTGVGTFHTLMFDVVHTNAGTAFHPYSGIIMVPESGLYVFTWSFRLNISGSFHTVELVVKNAAVAKAFGIVGNGEHDQTSATVVIYVQKGNDVFIRTGGSINNGQIYSDSHGYTYFAGWSLQKTY